MKKLIKVCKVACTVLSLFILFYIFSFVLNTIQINGSQELRESAIVITTSLLISGKNPYDLDLMPVFVNVYGIFYHLLVAPIAFVFGSNFFIHRLYSALFLFLSCYLIFKTLIDFKIDRYLAFCASVLLLVQLALGYDLLARPDSLGLFLFLLSVLIPYKYSFSNKSLFFGLLFSILAYLTKPYFIVGIFYIGAYLFLFISKKKGLIFSSILSVSFFLLILILNKTFETYILNTIFIHMAVAGNDKLHLYRQLLYLMMLNFSVIIILMLTLRKPLTFNPRKFISKYFKEGFFDIKNINKPLIINNINFLLFSIMASALLFCLKLGLHTGSFMTYLNHLLIPFLIIYSFKLTQQIRKDYLLLLFLALLFLNLNSLSNVLTADRLHLQIYRENSIQWRKILSNYHDVYSIPPLAYFLFDSNKPVYDTGQSQFFADGLTYQNKIYNYQKLRKRYDDYVSKLDTKLTNKEFDLVILIENYFTFLDRHKLSENYYFQESLPIFMYTNNYMAEVWLPKP